MGTRYSADGLCVDVYPQFLLPDLADQLFIACDQLEWKSDQRRLNITFGDPGLVYTVTFGSNTMHRAAVPWSHMTGLWEIKQLVEAEVGQLFNFCAIMRYPSGQAVIKRHRDKEMVPGSIIAGLSVGVQRTLQFTPPNSSPEQSLPLDLPHGSLYVMRPPTNDIWTHEILPSTTDHCRYSLTFRYVPNTFPINEAIVRRCSAIIKSGTRSGQPCGNRISSTGGTFCGYHSYTTSP